MSVVDDYLSGLDAGSAAAFAHLRTVVMEVVPEADDGTSYGMPVLRYRGKPLLGFRAAKAHLSLFPFSATVVEAVRDRLGGYDLSKGTIRFSADIPVPDDVVRDITRLRVAEIAGSTG